MSGSMSWRFHSDLSDKLRKAAVDWARSNGLDTNLVPFNALFTIADGQLSTEYLPRGQSFHGGHIPVTVPLLVPLPEPFASAPGAQHAPKPPWRFDVPQVPARVTCVQEVQTGRRWVRGLFGARRQQWAMWSDDPQAWQDAEWIDVPELLACAPLVECEDPRGAA